MIFLGVIPDHIHCCLHGILDFLLQNGGQKVKLLKNAFKIYRTRNSHFFALPRVCPWSGPGTCPRSPAKTCGLTTAVGVTFQPRFSAAATLSGWDKCSKGAPLCSGVSRCILMRLIFDIAYSCKWPRHKTQAHFLAYQCSNRKRIDGFNAIGEVQFPAALSILRDVEHQEGQSGLIIGN